MKIIKSEVFSNIFYAIAIVVNIRIAGQVSSTCDESGLREAHKRQDVLQSDASSRYKKNRSSRTCII